MRSAHRSWMCLVLAAAAALLWTPIAAAQGVTTGIISGVVTDQDGTVALPGATVQAVHTPTGTRYNTVSNNDGRFVLQNVRIGGPYTVTITMAGFEPKVDNNVFVKLGGDTKVDARLDLEAVSETVTVTGEASDLISPSRTGAASNVGTEELVNLPTIGRGFEDFARLNPFFAPGAEGDDPTSISVAGRNNRYNNIQIDGAVNNDLFGLADTGTPGGQTETTPISLDAVQELQLVLAPFDVRQGGFSGGGINAVTRSGTNAWEGSAYYFTRDDGLVGDGPDDFPTFGTFEDTQYGFRLGGPMSQDKAFFFVNAEITTKDTPAGFSIDGSTGQAFQNGALVEEANRFRGILQNQYGYDPGGNGEFTRGTDSDKLFARFDFNLADNHQLTVRHNYVDAENDIIRPSSTSFEFASHNYAFTSETNSTVGQLNSVFGPNSFNEFRLTYQTIRDNRGATAGQAPFPNIRIEDANGPGISGGPDFEAGTEAFSTHNSLDQDIIELTNDFTFLKGNHTITIGTHNEFLSFENLFIQQGFGAYRFDDLDAFEQGIANRWDYTFANPGQDPVARFDVNQLGFYVGDQWAARPNLTLNYGVRVDVPLFPDEPGRNMQVEELYGFRTDVIPDGETLISPRLGFNWDVKGDGESQVRGGVGIFSGRPPYVWVSNQFSRTGIVFTSLQARGEIPFNPDPFGQPTSLGGASSQEVNLIDPNFKFPSVLRLNLAYDTRLPFWGLYGSIEAIHADSQEEIAYRNVNVRPTGERLPFDNRPLFERVSSDFSGAYLLTNTSEGEQTNVALKVERPFREGVYGFVSYTWGEATVVTDGTSSRAVSNWQFTEVPGDPNNPPVSTSDFEVEHRFNAALSYRTDWGNTRWGTTFSAFYNHQSGRPYSTIYAFSFPSINGDRFGSNDLLYVPSGPDDVLFYDPSVRGVGDAAFQAEQWAIFNAYISADDGLDSRRGSIVPRNASRAPWSHSLDLRIAQDIPTPRDSNLQVTLDILNFGNLLDSDSGHVRYTNFAAVAPVTYQGFDAATGKPIYELEFAAQDPDNRFTLDDLRSRWRAQIGVRWTF